MESKILHWTPYAAGRDCAKNGPNEVNCHFRWFGSVETTSEWERGKRDGDKEGEKEKVQG